MRFISRQLCAVLPTTIILLAGCRGTPFEGPPLHLVLDMDDQPKIEASEPSLFFQDRAGMREPVPGTVARGELRTNNAFYQGKDAHGQLIGKNPLRISESLLKRGQDRFNIYCSPCHGASGGGRGIVAVRGIPLGQVPPVDLHNEELQAQPDGHYFDVISNGIRNMYSMRHLVPTSDRWAIVYYIRALQRSQNASFDDLPESEKDRFK